MPAIESLPSAKATHAAPRRLPPAPVAIKPSRGSALKFGGGNGDSIRQCMFAGLVRQPFVDAGLTASSIVATTSALETCTRKENSALTMLACTRCTRCSRVPPHLGELEEVRFEFPEDEEEVEVDSAFGGNSSSTQADGIQVDSSTLVANAYGLASDSPDSNAKTVALPMVTPRAVGAANGAAERPVPQRRVQKRVAFAPEVDIEACSSETDTDSDTDSSESGCEDASSTPSSAPSADHGSPRCWEPFPTRQPRQVQKTNARATSLDATNGQGRCPDIHSSHRELPQPNATFASRASQGGTDEMSSGRTGQRLSEQNRKEEDVSMSSGTSLSSFTDQASFRSEVVLWPLCGKLPTFMAFFCCCLICQLIMVVGILALFGVDFDAAAQNGSP